jgi:transcriptional regulator with XRE-family HTH domain
MNAKDRVRKKIVKLRQEKSWTQEKLAIESDIAKSSLCSIESGKQAPTIVTLEKIAKALKVKLSEIVS